MIVAGGAPDTVGIGDLLHQLMEDATEVARAEVAVQRVKIVDKVAGYRLAALFFAVAGTLAFATLIALLVGLILTLTPVMGPGWATALVCGVTLVIVAILGLLGRSHLQQTGE